MTTTGTTDRRGRGSAWALGGVAFAATILILAGLFQAIQGLAAIINDEFFVEVENYSFEFDLTAWGWIHLIMGVILVLVGAFLLTGSAVASATALGFALVSALVNFLYIPHYPFWSMLIIALNIFVIWAIIRVNETDA